MRQARHGAVDPDGRQGQICREMRWREGATATIGRSCMPNDQAMAKRILCLKIKAPSADAANLIVSMIKNAMPIYKTFGGTSVRLLRNADDQAQFMQVIEYETDAAIESGRQKLASE